MIQLIGPIVASDKTLYICDKRACAVCRPECEYTSNIEHAVYFKKDGVGNFVEVDNARKNS